MASLQSCHTDPKIVPELSECPTINDIIDMLDDSGEFGIGGNIFIGADSGITCVNYVPGNNDEFICYYSGYLSNYTSTLVKYNLITKEFESILVEPDILSLPNISSTGWLIFTGSNYQLWKVKINGDSLTQITFNGLNFESAWSPDGERIIYKQDYPIGTYNTVIADKNGNFLFSILGSYKIRKPTWSPDGRFIACSNFNGYYTDIDLIDTTTWEVENLINGNNVFTEQIKSIDFFPDSKHLLWATDTELRKTNIETKVTEVIATSCDSQGFDEINISDDGQMIIVKKTIYSYFDSKHILLTPRAFLLDANGNMIKEIIL